MGMLKRLEPSQTPKVEAEWAGLSRTTSSGSSHQHRPGFPPTPPSTKDTTHTVLPSSPTTSREPSTQLGMKGLATHDSRRFPQVPHQVDPRPLDQPHPVHPLQWRRRNLTSLRLGPPPRVTTITNPLCDLLRPPHPTSPVQVPDRLHLRQRRHPPARRHLSQKSHQLPTGKNQPMCRKNHPTRSQVRPPTNLNFLPTGSHTKAPDSTVVVEGTKVHSLKVIKLLAIKIDQHLLFKDQISSAISKTLIIIPLILHLTFSRGT